MKNLRTASLEAKLKNSKDLVIAIKDLTQYDPSLNEIRTENYEAFVNEVDQAVTPYKNAGGNLSSARNEALATINKLVHLCKTIRSEVYEMTGEDSSESAKTESIVRLITGENIKDIAVKRKLEKAKLKEGEQPGKYNSVSALDRKSRLGNFRTLLGILKAYSFYAPKDSSITIAALEAFELELKAKLDKVAECETSLANERSRIAHYFTGSFGLRDRALRAKRHVKRKYGNSSAEYKLLVKKSY